MTTPAGKRGTKALNSWRARNAELPEIASVSDLYDLTVQQVWGILKNPGTPKEIRQKYHLAILRVGAAKGSREKERALGALMSLSKKATGTDGHPVGTVLPNPADQDQE